MNIPKKSCFVAAVLAVSVVTGVAFGEWNTGGAGHGTAQARSAVALSTTAVPASSASLYPGADAKATVRVTNDNDYDVRITGVAYGAPAATPANGALGACVNGADAALVYTDQTGLALDVAAHSSTTFDVNGVHMNGTSASGCQGATFTIPVTLVGASNVNP